MILVVFVGLAAAIVPLVRGRLMNLAQLKFRGTWLLLIALGMQVALMTIAGPRNMVREATYIGSYVLAAIFLFQNRRIPGFWLVGVGALMNFAAITANGGVMPASPHALAAAGLPATLDHFTNSTVVASPNLAFLGDVFAIPRSWPLSNVFSAGDICVALGAAVAVHRVSGSLLLPSGRGQFAPLFRNPTFMRLWGSQAISNLGDWTYSLAVVYTLARRHSPQAIALLLIVQVAPAALFGGLLAPLADRHSRIKLMIGADVVRAAAVGSLFIATPSVVHIYGVAAILGIFGSIFQPSLQASIPNVVEKEQVVAANAMVGATYHFALMAGPALGGLLVYALGPTPVFAINAISFVVSAGLIAGIRLPKPTRREDSSEPKASALKDLAEGARYAVRTPLVRGLLIVIGLVIVAAASKAPLETLFVLDTLSLGSQALGLVLGCWGLGMLLGSVAAPAMCRKWPRETILSFVVAVVGLCVLMAAQARDLETVLLAWLVAGAANSIGNISYESLLQERTPDHIRGRVFAAFETVTNVGFLTGAFLAGWLGSKLGIRLSYVFSGSLFLAAALLCRVLLGRRRSGHPVLVGFERLAALRRAAHPKVVPVAMETLVPVEAPRPVEAPVGVPVAVEPILQPVVPGEPVDPIDVPLEPLPVPVAAAAELVSSFDPAERLMGVTLAAEEASDPLVATIIKALSDPAPQVRRRAAVELGRLRISEAIPVLDHALDDFDAAVRAAAVDALCQMPGETVLSSLVSALKDESDEVRGLAAAELLSRQSETVVRLLGQSLGSRAARHTSLDLLTQIGPSAVEPLVDLLATGNGIRPALGAALARIAGSDRFVEDLSMLDVARRRRAIEALGAMGGSTAVESLIRALTDPEPSVRGRAAELLAELGDPQAAKPLENSTFDPVPEVAEAARRGLASLRPAEAESALVGP